MWLNKSGPKDPGNNRFCLSSFYKWVWTVPWMGHSTLAVPRDLPQVGSLIILIIVHWIPRAWRPVTTPSCDDARLEQQPFVGSLCGKRTTSSFYFNESRERTLLVLVVEGATLQNQDEQGVNTKPMAHPKAQAKRSKQKRNVKMLFTRG